VSVYLSDRSSSLHDGLDPSRVTPGPALRHFLTDSREPREEAELARCELTSLVAEHFAEGLGILVLTGLPSDPDSGRRAVLRASRLLGEPMRQNREGALIREVRDRGKVIGEGARGRYSDSRFGGYLHTDGAEAPLPAPDIFTLFCVRQASSGGALEFVHMRDLMRHLDAEVLHVLRSPFHFDRRGDQYQGEPPTTEKPILFTQNSQPAITYLRSYVEQGHRHPSVPNLTVEQRAALDALDTVINSGELTKVGKQREGELALFDNLSLLHGRTEFRDTPEYARLLFRTWVNRHSTRRW
jgi:TfdA family taurine catabolism dioxygenase TauD